MEAVGEGLVTLPNERTRAVLMAKDFLVRLSSAYVEGGIKGIRSEVRREARNILRHFPFDVDLMVAGGECPGIFDHKTAEEWNDER
jgi:hypothetical protein